MKDNLGRSKLKTPLAYQEQARKFVWKAKYTKALRTVQDGLSRWSDSFLLRSAYASILGDYAEELPPTRHKTCKQKACKLLRHLLLRHRGVDPQLIYRTKNEYYYHSGQFKKQYLLGTRNASARGRYSQGVGAAQYARILAEQKRMRSAFFWAQRAIRSWERFFKTTPDYYNAYVHYALALGIVGQINDMNAALRKAGKLSHQPQAYREFKEVRDAIKKIHSGGSNTGAWSLHVKRSFG
ncbi:hypothetical protein ACFL6Y_10195 [Elusimicrobiota bacterium]